MGEYIPNNIVKILKDLPKNIKKLDENTECKLNYKDTYNLDSNVKIFVIGDIHADFPVLVSILRNAYLMDENYQWIGGNSHVVQMGDIVDGKIRTGNKSLSQIKSYEEFLIFDLLNDLNEQAMKTNGRVHYLIGNHELMNIAGDFSYVLSDHLFDNELTKNQYDSILLRKKLFKPGGYICRMLACHSYGILKINGWIFCHGGLLPKHLKNKSITDINNLLRDILKGTKNMDRLTNKEYKLIFGKDSVFWNRQYKYDNNRCNILNLTLQKANASKGIVLGHTPHPEITEYKCNSLTGRDSVVNNNKRIVFVDVGLSRSFDKNTRQIMVICGDNIKFINV